MAHLHTYVQIEKNTFEKPQQGSRLREQSYRQDFISRLLPQAR